MIIVCTGCSGWRTQDKALMATYTVFNTVDILQTRYIKSNDEYDEKNPILNNMGKNEATAVQVGTNVIIYFAADGLPIPYRTWVLGIATGIKVGVTAHNASIGVGFKF